jgi:hypothetical protein
MAEAEFERLFERFKSMLAPYAERMYVSADSRQWFGVDMAPEDERDPSTWFGAARVGKRYVSYYLTGLRPAEAARRRVTRAQEADAGQVLLQLRQGR